MKAFRLALLLVVFCSIALSNPSPKADAAGRTSQDPNASSANSKVVYVTDFDLDVARRGVQKSSVTGNNPPNATSDVSGNGSTAARTPSSAAPPDSSNKTSRSAATGKAADSDADEGPADRASALLTAMANNLEIILEKAGYTVHRVRGGERPPQSGLRIRGVFAEPDEQNRIRRLLVGGDSTSPKMLLYVGVDDLARPEQPLYELSKPQSNDAKHGPVITVTSYSPVVRFEMDKNPADEDLKKIATDIVADLNALLKANPPMASQ